MKTVSFTCTEKNAIKNEDKWFWTINGLREAGADLGGGARGGMAPLKFWKMPYVIFDWLKTHGFSVYKGQVHIVTMLLQTLLVVLSY